MGLASITLVPTQPTPAVRLLPVAAIQIPVAVKTVATISAVIPAVAAAVSAAVLAVVIAVLAVAGMGKNKKDLSLSGRVLRMRVIRYVFVVVMLLSILPVDTNAMCWSGGYICSMTCDTKEEAIDFVQSFIASRNGIDICGCSFEVVPNIVLGFSYYPRPDGQYYVCTNQKTYNIGTACYMNNCSDPTDPCCPPTPCCGNPDPCCGNPCCGDMCCDSGSGGSGFGGGSGGGGGFGGGGDGKY
ncbi:MAG: hypothetical protein FD174_1914 [Geobacteraceae bacterium]|nr:MAG: hypothetical protein FD174_1914 [Geobacteraceae bacterium]